MIKKRKQNNKIVKEVKIVEEDVESEMVAVKKRKFALYPFLIIIFLINVMLYSNTFNADFVYDDRAAVIMNNDIKPEAPWGNLLINDFWGLELKNDGSHKSFRPITSFTFKLNTICFGLKPYGFHLINVLLHSINSVSFIFFLTF